LVERTALPDRVSLLGDFGDRRVERLELALQGDLVLLLHDEFELGSLLRELTVCHDLE